jgi:TIGR03009 family protein
MLPNMRVALGSLAIALISNAVLVAQQPVAALPPVQQPAAAPLPAQAPQGFELNAIQSARLDQVLNAWQSKSGEVTTFKCAFERWEYNVAFGPGPGIPLNKDKGEVSYHRPDKGSFQITEINKFQAQPLPQGQSAGTAPQGNWVKQADAIGEHWVCDGQSVFEYRHDQKQLVERPIPPQLQGQAITDGPLPFLFGAESAKLKQRYWLRIHQETKDSIWLVAKPRYQEQAAEFKEVDVMLDPVRLLPTHMRVHLPNGGHQLYIFDLPNASINSPLARLQALFARPRVPGGWKRVVEEMPVQQAAQPIQPVR